VLLKHFSSGCTLISLGDVGTVREINGAVKVKCRETDSSKTFETDSSKTFETDSSKTFETDSSKVFETKSPKAPTSFKDERRWTKGFERLREMTDRSERYKHTSPRPGKGPMKELRRVQR